MEIGFEFYSKFQLKFVLCRDGLMCLCSRVSNVGTVQIQTQGLRVNFGRFTSCINKKSRSSEPNLGSN